jgi:hypothetical protein
VLVADWGNLSLLDKKSLMAVTCLVSTVLLIAGVIMAFLKPEQKRRLVISQTLLVVYWVIGAWLSCILAYAVSHMP